MAEPRYGIVTNVFNEKGDVMRLRYSMVALTTGSMLMVMPVATATPALAGTASGTTAVKTQLEPQPKVSGVTPILWVPASTKLKLDCLALGERAYGAITSANPYYYRTTYKGKIGFVSDSDVWTTKDATALGLTYCSAPSAARNLAVKSVTSSSATITWADNSNNETSFKTQYSSDGGKNWKSGPTTKAGVQTAQISGLAAANSYALRVGATNNKGTTWTSIVTAVTKPKETVKNIGSGACDYVLKKGTNDYTRSVGKGKSLGTYTLNGWKIAVCGPIPNTTYTSNDLGVNPFGGTPSKYDLNGYQCTELAARWLFYAYGVKIAGANGTYGGGDGVKFVDNYVARFGDKFVAYSNAKTNPPMPGDVISFRTGTPEGHVGIVYSFNIKDDGTRTVTVLEQNSTRQKAATTGKSDYAVTGTRIDGAVDWLHRK